MPDDFSVNGGIADLAFGLFELVENQAVASGEDLFFVSGYFYPESPYSNTALDSATEFSLTATGLPLGLSVVEQGWSNSVNERNYYQLTGTPTESGTFTVTVSGTFRGTKTWGGTLYDEVEILDSITINLSVTASVSEVNSIVTRYKVNGADLNTLFAGLSGLTSGSATGYEVDGADLNTLFAKLVDGASGSATGYEVDGADLNTLFAAIGTL